MKTPFIELLGRLPPAIARKDVPRLLGGIIESKTLANLDSSGKGVRNRYKVGRTVFYKTVDLLKWLDERTTIVPGCGID